MNNEMMKERLWILACDHRQFEYYSRLLKEHSFKYGIDLECRYISSPRILQGNRKQKYVRVGSWSEKRDLEFIFELLYVLEFENIEHPLIEREKEERERYEKQYYEKQVYTPNLPDVLNVPEFITPEEMTI